MKDGKKSEAALLKFLVPSAIGVLLFLIPFQINGEPTLIINLIIDKTKELLGAALVPIVIVILFITAICSMAGHFELIRFKGFWADFFNVKLSTCIVRILSAMVSVLIYFKTGPEFIWSANTGGMMMSDVVANLVPFFSGVGSPCLC